MSKVRSLCRDEIMSMDGHDGDAVRSVLGEDQDTEVLRIRRDASCQT
jgi:hypothetical protein